MIREYADDFRDEIVQVILNVQNVEYGVGIALEEQPDILDIKRNYIDSGGGFWVALNDKGHVVGTIGLQGKTETIGILKKFFVNAAFRGKEFGYGTSLYDTLLEFASNRGFEIILLDTPSAATRSHSFYKKMGFKQISKQDLPVTYEYPDRNSLLFRLDISKTNFNEQ